MTKSSMKTFLLLLSFCLLTAVNCEEGDTYKVDVYEPLYASVAELRQPIEPGDPQELKETGKIYIKDNYIFINEKRKGVHVIDNSVPETPQNIAFIEIPGNLDIAVKGNILYGDSYTDLVVLDITNPSSVVQVKRIENVFKNPNDDPLSMPDLGWENEYEAVDSSKGIVIGWEKTGTREYEEDDYDTGFGCGLMKNEVAIMDMASNGSNGGTSGKGGSMAKFAIVDDYLYTLNGSDMQLFRIEEPSNPTKWVNITIQWDIETIFPYKDKLFIGSMSGMYIYDNSDPANPRMIAEFSHASSCDPVFVQDDYAFVTLRGGTSCGGFNNQLDIIDISDPAYPSLIKTYAMQGPYGLAADRNTLFICDGDAGVKIFDKSDVHNLKLITQIAEYSAYDVILNNNIAIVISPAGLYQYDYSDLQNIRLLSSILVSD